MFIQENKQVGFARSKIRMVTESKVKHVYPKFTVQRLLKLFKEKASMFLEIIMAYIFSLESDKTVYWRNAKLFYTQGMCEQVYPRKTQECLSKAQANISILVSCINSYPGP